MSSAAFYYKLNKSLDKQRPIGSIKSMMGGIDSVYYQPSGDMITLSEFPILNAFMIGQEEYYRGIDTTNFLLTGQIPLNYVACSPTIILAVGQNSKIYLSTAGETWTSYNCPSLTGVFTNIFVEYAPAPINKFYISDVASNGVETIYTSTDGVSWVGYTGVSGGGSRWIPSLGVWGTMRTWSTSNSSSWYSNWYYLITKSDITTESAWVSGSYLATTGAGGINEYCYTNTFGQNFTVNANQFTLIGYGGVAKMHDTEYGYAYNSYMLPFIIPSAPPSGYQGGTSGFYHVVNGLYQTKFLAAGAYHDAHILYSKPYTNAFTLPSTVKIVYDVKNNRYMAIDPVNNYFYISTDGVTWSTPVGIGGTAYTLNCIGIRHNQDRIVACGKDTKTTDNYGTNWASQVFLTLGGNFTSIATDNITGNTVSSALASSTIAKATNGMNFDIVSITTSADWQNVYYDGTKFIITSRARDLKTSGDSITWTAQATHTAFTNSAHYITSMAHSGAHYCAISPSSVDTLTSVDGITWAKRASTVPIALNSISIGTLVSGTVRTVAVGTNICYTSDDYGVTAFTTRTIGTGNWSNLSYNNSRFVCISLNSLLLAHSTDGITWTTVVTPFQPKSLVYTDNMWIIKGSTTLTSTNDLITFRLSQPCEDTTSGAITVYDSISEKVITANATSISYADISIEKIRLPYVESSDSGIINYIKVA